ncbi:hypothetical protein BN946_scf185033.g10 [Trametes cinnabarina]|uniref:Uncharacterized protein n=1 Tax=Pycnoporus cinnabarinus TaxID=5643 RepID=A0A060SWG8_PYCCI|nr:hypothetical protein BN946_scf185033.g10 [Trametes cinnabarina]
MSSGDLKGQANEATHASSPSPDAHFASIQRGSDSPSNEHLPSISTPSISRTPISPEELETFPDSDHQYIAKSQHNYVYLPHYVHLNRADPAVKQFIPKLQSHLLSQLHQPNSSGACYNATDSGRHNLVIEHDRIYSHQLLRVNYTTYDVRRGQDIINPSTERCDIMLLAHEDVDEYFSIGSDNTPTERHMFWYARVLGIYHANVVDLRQGVNALPKRMEFLFVRWFGHDPEWSAGWAHRRLEQVGFVPDTDPDAFGFVDPNDVIRACHLIPAFAEGQTNSLLGWSKVARRSGDTADWERYYVNRFADRDMLMRYLGGGIGHRSMYRDARVPSPIPVGPLTESEDDNATVSSQTPSNPGEDGNAHDEETPDSDRDTDRDLEEAEEDCNNF